MKYTLYLPDRYTYQVMARKINGCSYTASVDPIDTELMSNVAAVDIAQ